MDPEAFEQPAAELLHRLGFQDVVVTRYSRDGGIDIHADFGCAGISRQHHVFQVKRTTRPVGESAVRLFQSAVHDHQGVFVTTSRLLPGAQRVAQLGRRPIAVVEGDAFAELLIETRVRCSAQAQ